MQKAEVARLLFTVQLDFDDVQVHKNLGKDQVLKQIDSLSAQSEAFEKDKGEKDVFTVAIVNIGRAFAPETIKSHK